MATPYQGCLSSQISGSTLSWRNLLSAIIVYRRRVLVDYTKLHVVCGKSYASSWVDDYLIPVCCSSSMGTRTRRPPGGTSVSVSTPAPSSSAAVNGIFSRASTVEMQAMM
jgi:hypothetical protein